MLQRVENVRVSFTKKTFTSKGRVHVTIGNKLYTLSALSNVHDFNKALADSATYPICFVRLGERAYWLFQNRWHWDNENLTPDQIYGLLIAKDRQRQQTIHRAQTIAATQWNPAAPSVGRRAIPADVKQLVWARDGGRCRRCGSTTELQFDHIIPHSMGGADSENNLQILCGPCNRGKGASIS